MRNRAKRDTALALAQIDALATLTQEVMNSLQSVKHGDTPSIVTMRNWVLNGRGSIDAVVLAHMMPAEA